MKIFYTLLILSGVQAGLEALLNLEDRADGARQVDGYYPYHAARADLLRRANQHGPAAEAYARALALCGNRAERAYLQRRLNEMRSLEG